MRGRGLELWASPARCQASSPAMQRQRLSAPPLPRRPTEIRRTRPPVGEEGALVWRGVIFGVGGRGRRGQEETGEESGSVLSHKVTGTGLLLKGRLTRKPACFLVARPHFPHVPFPPFHELSKQPQMPVCFSFCGQGVRGSLDCSHRYLFNHHMP